MVSDLDDTTIELLADETADALRELFGINVDVRTDGMLTSACGVHGRYHPGNPPRIEIERSNSRRRDRFSLLHEYGHDRIHRDYVIADDLDPLDPAARYRSRELVADAVAARILMPEAVVGATFAGGVKAPAVAALFRSTNASREACAVRAADALDQTGAVMIGYDNIAIYTAHRATPWWVARGTAQPQSSILRRAEAVAGRVQGSSVVRFATGNVTTELHADAVYVDGWVYAVLTTTRPPGGGLSVAVGEFVEQDDVECATCDSTFRPYGKPHTCGDYVCPNGHCACPTGPPTRRCESCGLQKAINQFDDGGLCVDCR